jgi:hypothetical protein
MNGVSVLAAAGASGFLRKDTPPERLAVFVARAGRRRRASRYADACHTISV